MSKLTEAHAAFFTLAKQLAADGVSAGGITDALLVVGLNAGMLLCVKDALASRLKENTALVRSGKPVSGLKH